MKHVLFVCFLLLLFISGLKAAPVNLPADTAKAHKDTTKFKIAKVTRQRVFMGAVKKPDTAKVAPPKGN